MPKQIFPERLSDLKAATSEDLAASLSAYEELLLKVKERDEDTLGDLDIAGDDGALAQAKTALAYRTQVLEEIAARAEVEAEFETEMAEATKDIAPKAETEEPPADGDGDEAAVEVDTAEVVAQAEAATAQAVEVPVEEPEAVTASVKAAKPRPPAPTQRNAPAPEIAEGPAEINLIASSGIKSVREGEVLDYDTLQAAMIDAWGQLRGPDQPKVVARADWRDAYPDGQRLTENMTPSAIKKALKPVEALVASGGLCAPVTPYYQLQTIATAARPVRDSLAAFQAVRGGLNFGSPLGLADIAGGVGVKTTAEDAAGGTFALKDCLFVECPEFDTETLDMIYECFQFGNLNSRAFPEMVSQVMELGAAYHARVAESKILDYIGASSTAVTQAAQYGAVATWLDAILYAAAGMRSRNRMDPNARLRLLLPAWTKELLSADTVNSQFYRGNVTPSDVDSFLRQYLVEPTWYLDGETGAGQIFGAQSAGALLDFPNTAVGYLFPEGSFLFLDGGTLDLGVVRDSTLNSTNDFSFFMETFEAAAFVGVESLKITATVCPSGATGGPGTLITCS